jgi:hypothetical protein
MLETIRTQARYGFEEGVAAAEGEESTARGLVQGAFTLLFTIIILAVAILVGGEFIGAIPTDGTFGDQISTLEDNAGTSFTLFAIGLLVIPAGAIVGYLWMELGGLAGLTGGGGGRGGLGR